MGEVANQAAAFGDGQDAGKGSTVAQAGGKPIVLVFMPTDFNRLNFMMTRNVSAPRGKSRQGWVGDRRDLACREPHGGGGVSNGGNTQLSREAPLGISSTDVRDRALWVERRQQRSWSPRTEGYRQLRGCCSRAFRPTCRKSWKKSPKWRVGRSPRSKICRIEAVPGDAVPQHGPERARTALGLHHTAGKSSATPGASHFRRD